MVGVWGYVMIKVIWALVKSFFVSNRSYLLIAFAVLAVIVGGWLVYQVGIKDGKSIAKQEYTELQAQQAKDALAQFITDAKEMMQKANSVSNAISKQLVERKLYDEQSTKALQDALKNSADSRNHCVFDDDVLQLIDAARESAVRATTSGITSTTGSAMRTTSETPR